MQIVVERHHTFVATGCQNYTYWLCQNYTYWLCWILGSLAVLDTRQPGCARTTHTGCAGD